MTLTTTSTLIGLAAAGSVAWHVGGRLGSGAIAGFLAGAALTGWGISRQRQVLRSAPERALRTMVESFLLKLATLLSGALLLAFVAPLRDVLDWRSFLVAFGAAVLVVLLPGTFDNARILKEGRSR